jgi:hypothetical protein
MTGPAAVAMNTADVAGLVRSELTAAGIRASQSCPGSRGRRRPVTASPGGNAA